MKDHANCCQYPGEDADIKSNRVNDSIQKGMQSNPYHGNETQGQIRAFILVADVTVQKAVEDVQR